MINVNEILKGSILCHEGKAKKVIAIGDYIQFEGFKVWIGGSMINGEPISETWLAGMGFNLHKNSNENWNHWGLENGWHISEWLRDKKVAGFEEKGVCYWGETFVPVRYVHELQLLYFSLTRQHLKVPKLPK